MHKIKTELSEKKVRCYLQKSFDAKRVYVMDYKTDQVLGILSMRQYQGFLINNEINAPTEVLYCVKKNNGVKLLR